MKAVLNLGLLFICVFSFGQDFNQEDVFPTIKGDFKIHCIGHGSLMFELDSFIIHVDPVSREADYSELPKADLILITHHHGDHLDMNAIGKIKTDSTRIIMTETCLENIEYGSGMKTDVMANGDKLNMEGIEIEAIPAYNMEHKRSNGEPYHPKGEGNGYVFSIADFRVLVAGDTENIPEIKALKGINVAFLPMNVPYTMTPEMVFDAAKSFKPEILYPYHYGNTDIDILKELMLEIPGVQLRIRAF